MKIDELQQRIREHLDEVERFKREDLPEIVGIEAVNHFNESFINEGFTDKSLQKWQNVKRRDPNSEWYGFSATNKKRFSQARSVDKVLTGESVELKNSIKYIVKPDRVTIRSDKPYASVHQFGEPAKVFGKKSFTMKARPFIGKSEVLEAKIQAKIVRELKNILKL